MSNESLRRAIQVKNDEFYTRIEDVEKELIHYSKWFGGQQIFLNCNDTEKSAFWKYLYANFKEFGIKKLTAMSYGDAQKIWTVDGDAIMHEKVNGNGSFNSEESVAELDESDIVITNPPFSLFKDFLPLLMKHNKKFLILGNMNAITTKNVLPYFVNGSAWAGVNIVRSFYQPDGSIKTFGNICWFTNMETTAKTQPQELTAIYAGNEDKYPFYDNFSAIEVSRVANIPKDYFDVMGVPITFISKHCLEQFEIVGATRKGQDGGLWIGGDNDPTIDGKRKYKRLLIRRKDR